MIYYQSKYLAEKTCIKAARWKRWVREFLPPDPLGGLQSGYARQFNLKDAFRVYLGGYLVSSLKFSVVEAGKVLQDLQTWLKKNGFFELTIENSTRKTVNNGCSHRIYIMLSPAGEFSYSVRTYVPGDRAFGSGEITERYTLALINSVSDDIAAGCVPSARVIDISYLYHNFLNCIASKT
jgi:hypothetical protein